MTSSSIHLLIWPPDAFTTTLHHALEQRVDPDNAQHVTDFAQAVSAAGHFCSSNLYLLASTFLLHDSEEPAARSTPEGCCRS